MTELQAIELIGLVKDGLNLLSGLLFGVTVLIAERLWSAMRERANGPADGIL